MLAMMKYLRDRYLSEKAQGMVEYALIIAFVVALAVFLTNGDLGTAIQNVFGDAATQINDRTVGGN